MNECCQRRVWIYKKTASARPRPDQTQLHGRSAWLLLGRILGSTPVCVDGRGLEAGGQGRAEAVCWAGGGCAEIAGMHASNFFRLRAVTANHPSIPSHLQRA